MLGLIRFIREESPGVLTQMVWILSLAGASNCAMVVLINAGAVAVHSTSASTREFILFGIALAIFVIATVAAGCKGRTLMETSLTQLRIRLFQKMQQAELLAIESLKASEVLGKISKDVGQILQSTDSLVFSFQALIMLVACCLYMATIQFWALAVVLAGIGVLGFVRYVRSRITRHNLRELIAREGAHAGLVGQVIGGFKEMKISEARGRDLFGAFTETAENARDVGVETGHHYIKSSTYMQGGAFIIMGLVVFIVPQFVPMVSGQIMILTTLIIFIIGAMMGVVTNIPEFAQADAALSNLYELEQYLDEAKEELPEDPAARSGTLERFDRITVDNLTFSYRDAQGRPTFSVGPLDLAIQRGLIHFIVGGNGSGKSTMLKLLTGLYRPDSGKISIDDRPLETANLCQYRNTFSAVFSEGYLFDRFYGLANGGAEEIPRLIERMKLQDKVHYTDGRFSTLELSTGQRKRLALIGALLEDREIYVFDEWAAEQDQHFRRYFYETILADLKQRGKTVVAVTHDEKYWEVADVLFEFEDGRLTGQPPA